MHAFQSQTFLFGKCHLQVWISAQKKSDVRSSNLESGPTLTTFRHVLLIKKLKKMCIAHFTIESEINFFHKVEEEAEWLRYFDMASIYTHCNNLATVARLENFV